MQTCETCRFRGRLYRPADHSIMGDASYACKRNAPLVTGGLHTPTMTVWPWIRLDDWCGEHEPKEQSA